MNARALAAVAAAVGARSASRVAHIQSLWRGYGEVVRVELAGASVPSAIVKSIVPPAGAVGDESDARKRRSYEVERRFYEAFASRCDATCRVARLLGAVAAGNRGESLLVLEDLDAAGFDGRRHAGDGEPIDRCLRWLAAFHSVFLGVEPVGLWATGSYWHLATRRAELERLKDPALGALARVVDARLAAATYQTLVHGDAKLANFCFAQRTPHVAAVDFQYVGRGPGVRDVAYLLAGENDETPALDAYFGHLRQALAARNIDPGPVESEWRALYPVASADFYRFLAGWSPALFARDPRAPATLRQVARTLAPKEDLITPEPLTDSVGALRGAR